MAGDGGGTEYILEELLNVEVELQDVQGFFFSHYSYVSLNLY